MNGFRYAIRKEWLAALTRDAIATADWFGDRNSHTRGVPVQAKNSLQLDPRHGNSIVRPVSIPPQRLNIGQTKRLLLAVLRLWELKNGYRR
jgi:hypothetical protein